LHAGVNEDCNENILQGDNKDYIDSNKKYTEIIYDDFCIMK
jgi:hypothetical protein